MCVYRADLTISGEAGLRIVTHLDRLPKILTFRILSGPPIPLCLGHSANSASITNAPDLVMSIPYRLTDRFVVILRRKMRTEMAAFSWQRSGGLPWRQNREIYRSRAQADVACRLSHLRQRSRQTGRSRPRQPPGATARALSGIQRGSPLSPFPEQSRRLSDHVSSVPAGRNLDHQPRTRCRQIAPLPQTLTLSIQKCETARRNDPVFTMDRPRRGPENPHLMRNRPVSPERRYQESVLPETLTIRDTWENIQSFPGLMKETQHAT